MLLLVVLTNSISSTSSLDKTDLSLPVGREGLPCASWAELLASDAMEENTPEHRWSVGWQVHGV